MKRFCLSLCAVLALSLLVGSAALASSLNYKAVNPSFGGDPLNASWLLSNATAQTEGGGQSDFSIDFPDLGTTTTDATEDSE